MNSANLPLRFSLASHVRACACDENVVLLDLRTNRYLGIDARASHSLAHSVVDWPSFDRSIAASRIPTESPLDIGSSGELLHRLWAQGLLVAAPEQTADERSDAGTLPIRQLDIDEALSTIELDGPDTAQGPLTRQVRQTLRFTASVGIAACWLRSRSLLWIANAIAARRARAMAPPSSESLESMWPAMETFERLRPLVFTSRSQCLLDSLALVRFLGLDGFMPRWVIGVRLAPFAAHSWVQCGPVVLNDQHEFVRQFRPILAV